MLVVAILSSKQSTTTARKKIRLTTSCTCLIDDIESVLTITTTELQYFLAVVSTTAYRFVRHDHNCPPGILDEPTRPEWLLKEREWVTVNTMSLAYRHKYSRKSIL